MYLIHIIYLLQVARTRLREEGAKYRTFWQTIFTVWQEEGKAGLYRCVLKLIAHGEHSFLIISGFSFECVFFIHYSGLATQLVRQIPNTAIMMSTYEAIVYILTRHFNSQFYDET